MSASTDSSPVLSPSIQSAGHTGLRVVDDSPVDDRLPPPARATDRDRDASALHVQEAVGRGQLTLAEATERLGQAYAARYRDEVDQLVADLPPERLEPAAAPGWAGC